jgi:predicted transcriptional regulator
LISAIPQFTFEAAIEPDRSRSGEVMDEAKSIFDEVDEAEEARAIAEAEAEIDAGQGVPHKKVRQWLRKLAKGKVTAPPCK